MLGNSSCFIGINYIGIQDAVDNGNYVKSHRKMNLSEIAYTEIAPFYYDSLVKDLSSDRKFLSGNVYFVPYTGSDASKEHVLSVNLNSLYETLWNEYGTSSEKPTLDNITLQEQIELLELGLYNNEKNYYKNVEKVLIEDYKAIEDDLNKLTENNIEISTVSDIQALIKDLSEEQVTSLFYSKGIDTVRGFHYFDKGLRKELVEIINYINEIEKSSETELVKAKRFVKKYVGDRENLGADTKSPLYNDIALIQSLGKIPSQTKLIEHKNLKNDPLYKEFYMYNSPTVLNIDDILIVNPLDYIFLLERLLFTLPFNRRTVGDIMQFKGKNLGKSYVESVKRNKMGVSTFYRYYTDLSKNPEGINTYSNIAIVNDPKQEFKSLVTKSKKPKDYPDGASFTLHFAQLKKTNSLGGELGFNPGIHHKSVGVNYHERTGVVSFQKHNDFTITNEAIRNSYGTKYDWQNYVNQMLSSISFDSPVDVNEKTLYYDVESDKVIESKPFKAKNMLDIWNGLGGAYTVVEDKEGTIEYNGKRYRFTTIDDKEDISRVIHKIEVEDFLKRVKIPNLSLDDFTYDGTIKLKGKPVNPLDLDDDQYRIYKAFLNQISQEKLKAIKKAEEESIKGKYIESISFVSAIKTGQINVNESNLVGNQYVFGDGKSLRYMKFDNRTRGVQLASEKDVEEGEATLPQQLIGATAFGGFAFEKAQKVYSLVKELAIQSIDKELKALVSNLTITDEDRANLIEYLRKFLSKNIEGLTTTQLTRDILLYSKNPSFDTKQISRIFVSNLNSFLTKEGIRKSVPGAQFVLKPPSQVYEVDGLIMQGFEYRKYKAEVFRKTGKVINVKPRDLKKAEFKIKTKNGFTSIENITVEQLNDLSFKLNLNVKFNNLDPKAVYSTLIHNADKRETKNKLENDLQLFINEFIKKASKEDWIATKGEVLAPSVWKDIFYITNDTTINDVRQPNYFRNKISNNEKAAFDFLMTLEPENIYDLNAFLNNDVFKNLDKNKVIEFYTKTLPHKERAKLKTFTFRKTKPIEISEESIKNFTDSKIKDFERGHTFVTQRIPLQSLASVMVNEIVGFINTEANTMMVNNDHQILTGGDYDVDKTTAVGENIKESENTVINKLIKAFQDVANDPRNILVRERAVDTAYLSEISDRYYGGKIDRMNNYSFWARAQMKYDNLLGKDEVGIFATALKSLSGITASFYQSLEDYNKLKDKSPEVAEFIKSFIKPKPITISLDGEFKTYSIPANIDLSRLNEETIDMIVNELYAGKNLEKLREELNLQDKAYDVLGELLNLAVDNAKELKLAGLNSTLTTGSIYSYGIVMGIPASDIARILNNEQVKNVLYKTQNSIYQRIGILDSVQQIGDEPLITFSNTSIRKEADKIKNKSEELKAFLELYERTEQFDAIGKVFSINQGLKPSNYDIFNFKRRLKKMMSDAPLPKRLENAKDEEKKKYIASKNLMINKFDFVKFIENLKSYDQWVRGEKPDNTYSIDYIKFFDEIKTGFNVLHLIAANPHYRAYYEVFTISEKTFENTSLRLANIENLLNHFSFKGYLDFDYLDEKLFNKFLNMFDDLFVDEFLQKYDGLPVIKNKNGVPFNFALQEDRVKFIEFVETEFFPLIKSKDALFSNEFIANLVLDVDTDLFENKFSYWRMNENPTVISRTNQVLRQNAYTTALRELSTQGIKLNNNLYNIYDVIRMYNLLLYKDSSSEKAFTKFLLRDDKISLAYNDFLAKKLKEERIIDFSFLKEDEKIVQLLLSNNIKQVSNKQNYPIFEKRNGKIHFKTRQNIITSEQGKVYQKRLMNYRNPLLKKKERNFDNLLLSHLIEC